MPTCYTGTDREVTCIYFADENPLTLLRGIAEYFGRDELRTLQLQHKLDTIHIEYDQHSSRYVTTVTLLEKEG